eukprot:superscaffoldBa00014621_g26406
MAAAFSQRCPEPGRQRGSEVAASGPELASLREPTGNVAVPTWLPPLRLLI